MVRRGRHRNGRVPPKGTRPGEFPRSSAHQGYHDEPPLLAEIREALCDEDPLALLGLGSSLIAALGPRRDDPFEMARGTAAVRLNLAEFQETFVHSDRVEALAMLAMLSQLGDDELLRARARAVVARRTHGLPRWLAELGSATATSALQMSHALGDGDNVMIGVSLPSGYRLSVVVYIDHNLGTVVKDAYPVSDSIENLAAFMASTASDPDLTFEEISLADARERITSAIALGEMTYPPFETETWPACRPLVEWAARLAPPGGTGYVRPDWDESRAKELAARFFASPFGVGLDDRDHRNLLESFLWFATDYGSGDPLRWSSVAVEILLVDWLPRKVIADADYLALAPDLLRAYVRFCHAERDVRESLTAETLEAIRRYEPEFMEQVAAPRRAGPAAQLASRLLESGALDDLDIEDVEELLDFESYAAVWLEWLSDAVGGPQALLALDDEPLADRTFSWKGIATDIRDRVSEVLVLCDQFCTDELDLEYRAACRAFLSRVARGNPAVFRRKGKSNTAAAAVCWTIGKVNELFSARGMRVMDLTAYFGVSQGSLSQRADTMIRAAGYERGDVPGVINLGDLNLLVSTRRRSIASLRDRLLELDPLD